MISFAKSYITNHQQDVSAFLAAVEKAVAAINAAKSAWDDLLVEKQLVPAALIGSYALPDFPAAAVPTEAQFADVLAWAQERCLVQTAMSYSLSVDSSYLP